MTKLTRQDAANRLAALLIDVGWTGRELARQLGCDPRTVSHWTQAERDTPPELLQWLGQVAQFLQRHPAPDYRDLRPASGRPTSAKQAPPGSLRRRTPAHRDAVPDWLS